MLENIKSHYINKLFFSHIDEKKKLEMVKYNKSLQNKLEIKMINYKLFSKKYIRYEIDGKVREYNYDDKLFYEGEYLNGKRNGKGKEYYYGSLIYEGRYLNGKRNGKGKEYCDIDGKLKFAGEYLDDKRK